MHLKHLTAVSTKSRISCSHYSAYDEIIIRKATSLGLPLIGGTALELWANATNTPNVRKRSDNDLDFVCDSQSLYEKFQSWIKIHIPHGLVKVDVMFVRSHDFHQWETLLDGVLVMKPEYLLWSKLTRGLDRDKQDIKWILSIKDLPDSDIQDIIDTLGLTSSEAALLEECIL